MLLRNLFTKVHFCFPNLSRKTSDKGREISPYQRNCQSRSDGHYRYDPTAKWQYQTACTELAG